MSDANNEKDLELKLRLMRLFWFNGYFVRRNINLARFESGRKTADQHTDIDVVCIKHDHSFNKKIDICDCKSGRTAKTTERLFWLSGVMKYFDADKGYFARTQMMQTKYVDLANKLEITPLSEEQLAKLEKIYGTTSKPFIGCFTDNTDYLMYEAETFRELKDTIYSVYEYIYYKYWTDGVQQQIISLINCSFQINKSKLSSDSKLFLCMYCMTMFTNSILDFSQYLLQIPENEQEKIIRDRILGGKLESYEKLDLLGTFYNFMAKEIEMKYNSKYPVSKNDFLSNFYPPYLKYLIDLIQRICSNPSVSIAIPKFLDIITYEVILYGNDLNKELVIKAFGENDLHNMLKMVKDIVIFGERSGFFESTQCKIIVEKLTNIQTEYVL